ncbi:MAG: SAM-dependent methyltransferase [Lachnospiraceae bacterium]|jgi:Trans-aconitate methyltransferase|nr:SAM-dependent methyltransferase [Lachnospiraceae bacterium]MCI9674597.1 SAM-dependent methyltransferase [Lachnospiraceae bacterium]
MEKLRDVFGQMLNVDLIQMTLSNSRDADRAGKIKIRPVLLKGEILFQETTYRGTQVFHKNYTGGELLPRLTEYMETLFKQAELKGKREEATVLVGKKGTVTVKRKKCPEGESKADTNAGSLSHNRTKRYILQEGQPVDFLIGLGVQTPDGKIAKARYDKFRQINRYLEFIEDVLDRLPSDRTLRIVDFGCGKSYLTFAMYYYLHRLQGRDIRVTGLDLKKDVIEHCNRLAKELHYQGLQFEQGDIQSYGGADAVDMVVSLHACDKATDYALEKAVKWGARVIMAVPCCQHELNGQIRCDILQPVLQYGLIKERISALITDALRADLLERQGYHVQILEFIDMEHTPKNLMIRAVKEKGTEKPSKSMMPVKRNCDIDEVAEFLHVAPALKKLLEKE